MGPVAQLVAPHGDVLLEQVIRAIPGRNHHRESGVWSVGLVNDRPRSLVRLIDRYAVAISRSDRAGLWSRVVRGDTFDLELVAVHGRRYVSLCDDWEDPELRALCEQLDGIEHPDVGRLSVVIDHRCARAVHELYERREDVRWTPPLQRAITEALAEATASASAVRRSRSSSMSGPRGPDRTAPVRFAPGRGELEIVPTTTLAAVQAVWRGAVGDLVAEQASPVAERDGVLTLACGEAVWAHELEGIGPELVARLNSVLGRPALRALRCRAAVRGR